MKMRLAGAILLPFLALALQWLLWPWIAPFVWFLFFPAVFFSARLGGLWGGLAGTVLSIGMVWFFFIPPQLSWKIDNPPNLYSVGLFLVMGYLFGDTQERLRRAQNKTDAVLAETRVSKEKVTLLYRKTLELDELETQFAAIVENSGDAIIGKTLDGVITSWNRSAEKIYGYSANEMIGQSLFILIPPELYDEEKTVIATIMSGKSLENYETERLRKDGSRIFVSITVSPIRNKEDRIIGASKIARDITERKLAEAKINELNAGLEQRVRERTAELTAANRELDAFAYAVSHDLRAPLRAMSGFSQALVEDYGDTLEGEAKTYLEQIVIASRRMNELIDGLLILSRCTRGELRRDTVDFSALVQGLLAELVREDPTRQVAVEVEAGLQARGDARLLEVVMRNLLGNAWKYTAHAEAPCIRIYAEERDGIRRFCVADNGAGFDMAHANRLFQPFQRLHRQEEFPGIGIGLATVQRIVHRHGGIIEAEGKPGKGAIFYFTLSDNMPADSECGEKEA